MNKNIYIYIYMYTHIWFPVVCRYPSPPPPLAMIYTRNLVRVVTLVSRVPTVAGMGSPSPRILVSVVAFEAMQLPCPKWRHSPGWAMVSVCAAPNPAIHPSPKQPHPHHRGVQGQTL